MPLKQPETVRKHSASLMGECQRSSDSSRKPNRHERTVKKVARNARALPQKAKAPRLVERSETSAADGQYPLTKEETTWQLIPGTPPPDRLPWALWHQRDINLHPILTTRPFESSYTLAALIKSTRFVCARLQCDSTSSARTQWEIAALCMSFLPNFIAYGCPSKCCLKLVLSPPAAFWRP